jgi:undecaprenyl-diphosphatase
MASFDLALFNYIHGLAGVSRLLDFISIFFAEYAGYFLVVAFITWVWWKYEVRERWGALLFASLSVLISRGLITEMIRFWYHRPRPFVLLKFTPLIEQADKGSFPSGHASFYFAIAAVLWMYDRRLGNYFAAIAGVMGIARVFVGVHWPLDIIGGALVALVSVYIVRLLLVTYQPVSARGSDGGRVLG